GESRPECATRLLSPPERRRDDQESRKRGKRGKERRNVYPSVRSSYVFGPGRRRAPAVTCRPSTPAAPRPLSVPRRWRRGGSRAEAGPSPAHGGGGTGGRGQT